MCKISQHSWTRQQGFGIDICVRRTQNAETDLDYRVNKHKNSNIYAYDYCKINVKYKLSDQIRHFPSNQLTNTLPLDHGCNFSGVLYNYSA